MAVANTRAYNAMEIITAVKSLIVQIHLGRTYFLRVRRVFFKS
jgi:hypothetical protein